MYCSLIKVNLTIFFITFIISSLSVKFIGLYWREHFKNKVAKASKYNLSKYLLFLISLDICCLLCTLMEISLFTYNFHM